MRPTKGRELKAQRNGTDDDRSMWRLLVDEWWRLHRLEDYESTPHAYSSLVA
jgi:hypothetical protein